jgi:hypothetical protein
MEKNVVNDLQTCYLLVLSVSNVFSFYIVLNLQTTLKRILQSS